MQLHPSPGSELSLERVSDRLRAAFKPLSPRYRRDPVSQLVRSILGGSEDAVTEAVFGRLEARFRPWIKLAMAREDEVLPLIAAVHEARVKASRLVDTLAAIRRETGAMTLDFLASWPLDEAMDWLQMLPGVHRQVAAAVLNFSTLRLRIVVIDATMRRIAVRLGFCIAADDADLCGDAVMAAAPDHWQADDFTEIHRLFQRLGHTLCVAGAPRCGTCPVRTLCPVPRALDRVGSADTVRRLVDTVPNVDDTPHSLLRRRIARLARQSIPSETMRAASVSLGRRELDCAFTGGALPPGLHQTAGARPEDGSAALMLPLAVALAGSSPKTGARLLLVQEADARRERGELHGPGLTALGLPPSEVAFVRVRDGPEALRVADEAVRSRAAPTIVLELCRGDRLADLSITRRFDLAARRSGLFVFLVTANLAGTSAAATRWRIAAAPSRSPRRRVGPPAFDLDLVRNRHGSTGRWLVEWSASERRFSACDRAYRDDDAGRPSLPQSVGAAALYRSGTA